VNALHALDDRERASVEELLVEKLAGGDGRAADALKIIGSARARQALATALSREAGEPLPGRKTTAAAAAAKAQVDGVRDRRPRTADRTPQLTRARKAARADVE
jgi:hypothetical protein